MFTATLLRIAKWMQFKCPQIDEWVNKLGYFHTMKYYSIVKKYINDTCCNLDEPENMLSERKQM